MDYRELVKETVQPKLKADALPKGLVYVITEEDDALGLCIAHEAFGDNPHVIYAKFRVMAGEIGFVETSPIPPSDSFAVLWFAAAEKCWELRMAVTEVAAEAHKQPTPVESPCQPECDEMVKLVPAAHEFMRESGTPYCVRAKVRMALEQAVSANDARGPLLRLAAYAIAASTRLREMNAK